MASESQEIETTKAEDFYQEITISASSFVSPELQEKLKDCKLLIAGAGSIGNPIAMMAIRSGMTNIAIADPDNVEESNLARQEYEFHQVGKNKARSTALNMRLVNPYASKTISSIPEGITDTNVENLVKESDIIVDGIDIRALDKMYELHKKAAEYKKPVLVGYDLAGTAMVAIYRYDKKDLKPLDGVLTEKQVEDFIKIQKKYDIGEITEKQFLDFVYFTFSGAVRPDLTPVEQLKEFIKDNREDNKTPQIGTTARVISALSIETMKLILNNQPVKDIVAIDLPSNIRKYNPSILEKMYLMFKALNVVVERGKRVKSIDIT